MKDINQVTLVGRLTKDAELRYTNSGLAIGRFSVAVNRSIKRDNKWEDEVSFFDCVIFNRFAETMIKYLVKGQQVAVNGELKQDRWQKDGKTNSKVQVIVCNLQLLGGGKANAQVRTDAPEDFQGAEIPF